MSHTPNINKILALPVNKACSAWGADMGRSNAIPDNAIPERLYLQRVTFVDGCYDRGGAYWGGPADLWCAFSRKDSQNKTIIRIFVRADNRKHAAEEVSKLLPGTGWRF